MLIVAIPKSGSTAIMETLGKGHGIAYKQFPRPEGSMERVVFDARVNPIRLFHGDVCNYEGDFLSIIARSSTQLYKQHIAPSSVNRKALAGERIVILLRDPVDIIDAYHRGFGKQIHRVPQGLPADISLEAWREHARKCGLLDALAWFHQAWSADPDPNWLLLDFKELTGSPKGSIRAVELHLGLPPSGLGELRKARYSKSLVVPYRHNRIWRDRVTAVRTTILRWTKSFVQMIARFVPGSVKRSALVRTLLQRSRIKG